MSDDDVCECGHVLDEHWSSHGECAVDGCKCFHYDEVSE